MAAVGARIDPLLSRNFVISLVDSSSSLAAAPSVALSGILDVAAAGFSECTGIEMSMAPEEYKEGGRNDAVLKFPSRITWSNITLKKGLGLSNELWDWHFGFVEGRGKRRDGVIALLGASREPQHLWYFRRGLPIKYTAPQLNAVQSAVAIESIEIAHEGIYQVPGVASRPGMAGAAG
jgi:phage tail-like protein